jgi:carbon starvation protein
MLAVMVVLFAGTTMDAGLRLQRYIIQEWGNIYSINPLKNNYVSTLVAIFACLALAFGVTNSNYENLGDGGMLIWPVFGATNQILASMTLLTIAVFLVKLGRPARYVLAPMIFILLAALWASGWYLINHFREGQWVLVVIEVAVVITTIFIMLEALSVLFKARAERDGGEPVSSSE